MISIVHSYWPLLYIMFPCRRDQWP